MERKLNLVINQEVILKNLRPRRDEIIKATIIKTTKKLITVVTEYKQEIKFEINKNYRSREKGESTYRLYESIEELENENKNNKMYSEIQNKFPIIRDYTYTNEQLERILKILNEK
jgi:hypothetical protein